MLRAFNGVTIRRTLDRSRAEVPEHAHDWPLLSLFVIGSYTNHTEIGEWSIAGPSAVFYAAGAAHRNTAGPDGFEQIEIEFDPAWLRSVRLPDGPVLHWMGGRGGAEARTLAKSLNHGAAEDDVLTVLRRFLETAPVGSEVRRPVAVAAG